MGEGEKSGSSVFFVFWLLGLFRVFVLFFSLPLLGTVDDTKTE